MPHSPDKDCTPVVINYRDGTARIYSWKNALVEAWQERTVSDADLRDLMVLHRYALPNGALCLANRTGPHKWWSETNLAGFLRIDPKTFRARWRVWGSVGWVESHQPPNPKHRTERWLGKAPEEGQVVRESPTSTLPHDEEPAVG